MTVVVVVGGQRDRAARCLRSVLEQDCIENLEIILIDVAAGTFPPLAGGEHPAVRSLASPAGTTFSVARAAAVRMAMAPIVVFLEEHCRAFPGWAAALIKAHQGPYAAVGAEIHNANPESRLSRIIELMNYNLWLPPATRGEFNLLPGHNSSFKRDVLLQYGDELETLLRAEVALYHRMHRDGHRLLLDPDAKFEHINETRLSSIASGYYLWHRCYGPIRAQVFGWGFPRRALYVVATPLIPIYYIIRLLLVLRKRRPDLLGAAILGTPQILFSQLASAVGQAVGLLFGIQDAEEKFTSYELNEPRAMKQRDPARPHEFVSIIIPAYRSNATIEKCMESLRRQTFRDFEIILVDSSPDDDAYRGSDVRLIRSQQQLMPQAARNLGVANARGDLFAFTDPDMYLSPEWLETLVRSWRQRGDVIVGSFACHGSRWIDRGFHLCKFSKWLPGGPSRLVDMSPSGNMLVSRTDFLAVHGYRGESFVSDVELSRDLRRLGRGLWFEPAALGTHHHAHTIRSFLAERFQRGAWYGQLRSEWYSKNPLRLLILCAVTVLPLRLASNLAHVAIHAWRAGEFHEFATTVPVVAAGYAATLAGEARSFCAVLVRRLREARTPVPARGSVP